VAAVDQTAATAAAVQLVVKRRTREARDNNGAVELSRLRRSLIPMLSASNKQMETKSIRPI
jgi:hypothetical protein